MLTRLLFACFLFCTTLQGFAQSITVGTYNLRYDNKGDSGNLWVNRAPVVAALIRFHDFDIIGTQEALDNQLNDLVTTLPQYARYGVGRDDGGSKGEHSAILYRKDRFELLDQGDFWLSPTPGKPTMGWDAKCCKRLCSWVYLKDKKTKKKFYFFNAHYDHEGKVARVESSKLVLEKIKTIAKGRPAIFTGDLNGGQDTECYQLIAKSGLLLDTYTLAPFPYANNGSFNEFGKRLVQDVIIDHVFVTAGIRASKWGVLTDSYKGRFPSDHFPVLVRVEL